MNNKIKKLKYLLIIALITTLGISTHFSYHYFKNNPGKANIVFDSIKSIQNHILSKFYTPSGNLPIYKIEISEKNYQKLISDLPASGKEYVEGQFILPDGKKVDASFRLRGGQYWHWASPKKSWRIKLEEPINNKTTLNFINPRHESQLIYPLGYHLGNQAEILSPEHNFVVLYINNEYQGVYDNIEQINQEFLTNHDQVPGDIFYGEPPKGKESKRDPAIGVYVDTELWDYKPAESTDIYHSYAKLEELIETTTKDLDTNFEKEISEIIDLDKTLRFIAIMNMIGTNHIDSFKNFKTYLNPTSDKFEPIVWDLFSWIPLTVNLDTHSTNNILFTKLLLIPNLAEKKNKYMWEFMNSFATPEEINEYIDYEASLIEHDLLFDPIKSYVEGSRHRSPVRPLSISKWKESVEYIKLWYKERHKHLIETLDTIQTKAYCLENQSYYNLVFDVTGEPSFHITNFDDENFTIYMDKNFDYQLPNNTVDTNLNNQNLYPGFNIEINPMGYAQKLERRTLSLSTIRYSFIIMKTNNNNKIEKEIINNITLINNITGTKTKPTITWITSLSEIPQPEDSDSLHPWDYNN